MFRPLSKLSGTDLNRPFEISSRISRPAKTSLPFSAKGNVNETLIVSPIPSLINCSKANRVLMIPSGGMPASVTPRCSGMCGRSDANFRLPSTTFFQSESFSETTNRLKPNFSSRSQCSTAL